MRMNLLICALAIAALGMDVQLRAAGQASMTIGGEPVAKLMRPRTGNADRPQLVEADFLPGRGMNLIQLKAYVPGKGVIPLLASPPLDEVKAKFDGDDPYGNESFKVGGAFLVPYANRIRGTLSPDGKSIEADLDGQPVSLPANWKGDEPGAEVHAIHGLILKAKFQNLKLRNGKRKSKISGVLHAGDFGGHWPSQTDVKVRAAMTDDVLDLEVTVTNVGEERLPISIGMHPYFVFPSGDRTQARVHIPATMRAPANNYHDTFPIGTVEPVKGTRFDFTAPDGRPLGTDYLDDSFTNLQRDTRGNAEVRVTDPAAEYGIKIAAVSKGIKAIQMYAPSTKNFVAIEPQYNLPDPFDKKIWGDRDTGVVFLKPGESTTWHVRFTIFGTNALRNEAN